MRPRLIYDGDCGFCRTMVAYAAALTRDRVDYQPYQAVAGEYPGISLEAFAGSIQLVEGADRFEGAQAAFRTLAHGERSGWLVLYRRVPGFAPVAEWLYAFVARHRVASARVVRALFGRDVLPRQHVRTADLVFRGILLTAVCAFVSFAWQATGLIGSDGILPLERYLEAVADTYGIERYWLLPTVFWLAGSDAALLAVCTLGAVASAIGLAGRWRLAAALVAYACYLSLVHAGQLFMHYQWDTLLAECLLLAAILTKAPTLGIWLARLLLFRFMLLSGFVKLASNDPAWADGSALAYHFETQPLPTVLAWYAHRLPERLLEAGVAATFVIELVLPWLVLLPRNPRLVAGAGFVLLETLILATGSYNFFNLLTLVLCVSLLHDRAGRRADTFARPRHARLAWIAGAAIGLAGLTVTVCSLTRTPVPRLLQATAPFLIANPYGLFAVMTTERFELLVEGTEDGVHWQTYGFPFKPGPLERAPRWAAPHQPRLDWQLWFAALGTPESDPWVYDFAFALLEARPGVLRLVEDPFDGARPAAVRMRRALYRFSTSEERALDGRWWVREAPVEWLPPIRLRVPKITHEPLVLPD